MNNSKPEESFAEQNLKTKKRLKINNWYLFYIIVPLLPFIFSVLLKAMTLMSVDYYYAKLTFLNSFNTFLSSWDSVKLFFACAIMAFFIKVDLRKKHIPLKNADKDRELNDRAAFLFLLGVCSFVFLGASILLNTLIYDCNLEMLVNTEIPFKVISLFLAFKVIKYGIAVKKEFKLTCENFI